VIVDVPAYVCPECGESYLSPDTVDALQAIVEGRGRPKKTLAVPVYEFKAIA
jgi:hypothetical protein